VYAYQGLIKTSLPHLPNLTSYIKIPDTCGRFAPQRLFNVIRKVTVVITYSECVKESKKLKLCLIIKKATTLFEETEF
jgi:hypothetical protein